MVTNWSENAKNGEVTMAKSRIRLDPAVKSEMKNLRTMSNKIWKRVFLHNLPFVGRSKRFDILYILKNPWQMDSLGEEYRFKETNRLISENFGRPDTILEVGCGEGHQSLYLQQVCNHLVGIDVSARAIRRAQKRCSGSDFFIGDIFSPKISTRAPFDLVVACEVLYYMNNVPIILQQLRNIGHYNLVSYHKGQMEALDPLILGIPGVASRIMEYEGYSWRVAWW